MSQNVPRMYQQSIYDIQNRLDNLIHLIDNKKNFYNNIFFSDKDREPPMNLYNIHFLASSQENNYSDNEAKVKQYQFNKPEKIFLLPSSEDSGDERNDDNKAPSFKEICDDIVDFETHALIDENKPEDRELPETVHPIIMFRAQDPFLSIEKVLGFIKSCVHNVPYEIKIIQIYKSKEGKNALYFIIKFYNYNEASLMRKCLYDNYKIESTFCYDKRELSNTKWICVIFRRQSGGEEKLSKFVQLIADIFHGIPEKNKKFICNSVEGVCEAKIDGEDCIRKLRNMLYCAIKVESLEQALVLCVHYNNYYDMKVNLHSYTYKMKKNKIPQILTKKDIQNENKINMYKIKKSYKEDDCYQNEIADFLFSKKEKILGKKHKRNKNKQVH